jgi:hypothetical protein
MKNKSSGEFFERVNRAAVVFFVLAALLVFLMFNYAASKIGDAGLLMAESRSVSGNTVAEHFYQQMRAAYEGISTAVRAFGVFGSCILLWFGLLSINALKTGERDQPHRYEDESYGAGISGGFRDGKDLEDRNSSAEDGGKNVPESEKFDKTNLEQSAAATCPVCPVCGEANSSDARFCTKCGSPLPAESPLSASGGAREERTETDSRGDA